MKKMKMKNGLVAEEKNTKRRKLKIPSIANYKWSKCMHNSKQEAVFPEPNYAKYRDFSSIELFELFFDNYIYGFIIKQTNLYAIYKEVTNINSVTKEEIKIFLAS